MIKAKHIRAVVAVLMFGLGVASIGGGVYGYVFAEQPTYSEYQTALESCDDQPHLNESEVRKCQNTTFEEYQSGVTDSFFAPPHSAVPAAFWILTGLGLTGFITAAVLSDGGLE